MCKKCKKLNIKKAVLQALKEFESAKGFTGHSVEPREKEPFLQEYPVNIEPRKTEYMRIITKGGIIKYENRLFQNSKLSAGIIGFFDSVNLKFRPIGQEECHVYDVVELDNLSS